MEGHEDLEGDELLDVDLADMSEWLANMLPESPLYAKLLVFSVGTKLRLRLTSGNLRSCSEFYANLLD